MTPGPCANCGKLMDIHRKPSIVRKSKSGRRFCSRACANEKGQKKNVGYASLHRWVERRIGAPSLCEICKRTKPPKGKGLRVSYFQWANISGRYLRDVKDWRRLCRKCHMRFDRERGRGRWPIEQGHVVKAAAV